MRLSRSLATALFVAMTIPPARAAAEEPSAAQIAAARDLFRAAMADEDQNRWAEALEKLRRVAAVKMTAGVRYHIALCEEHLGQLVAALNDYTIAESRAKIENAADVMKLAPDRLKALRARVPHLTIVVPSDVPSVAVKLDGETLPRELWGVAVPLDPGEHRIEATAPGRVPFDKKLRLEERESTLFEVKLPVEGPAPAPARAPAPGPAPATAPGPAPAPAPAPARALSPEDHAPNRTGAILATAGAAALAGGGIVAYLLAGGAHDDAVSQCRASTSPCDDLKQTVHTWDAVAAGAWIGAVAVGAYAVVLWTRSPDPAPRASVGVGPQGIVVRGSF